MSAKDRSVKRALITRRAKENGAITVDYVKLETVQKSQVVGNARVAITVVDCQQERWGFDCKRLRC